jgi:L-lactate utilization protein LutC
MLQRVRTAVSEGNRLADVPALPERGEVGYQGAGDNAVNRFCAELKAAGGTAHVVTDAQAACRVALDLLHAAGVRKALLSRCGLVERLGIAARIREAGIDVHDAGNISDGAERDRLFAAEAGISGVYRLIAETGTVVMATSPEQPRSVSLLPPLHIAFAEQAQLLPDLFDLFDLFAPAAEPSVPPACLTLITGPSKTGDIELKLVTGVHGPGELHVILIADAGNDIDVTGAILSPVPS